MGFEFDINYKTGASDHCLPYLPQTPEFRTIISSEGNSCEAIINPFKADFVVPQYTKDIG